MRKPGPIHQFTCTWKSGWGLVVLFQLLSLNIFAQCPTNLDFEGGTLDGWTCYTGYTELGPGGTNEIFLIPISHPVVDRHTLLTANPGDGVDRYGGFPVNCPNGSRHSIKLGNSFGGAQAEGMSYQFTIPATANKFSLIYNYAVVFQDPGHSVDAQPRMQVEVMNITDDSAIISCSSFSFVADNSLPGFQISTATAPGATPVLYRDWSSNTINLDGFEGKTIRFFVKTADCTEQAHFGYAYFDVQTGCSSTLDGALFCKDDTAVNVKAPIGYQQYQWFNSSLTQNLGNDQILHIAPPPPSGTIVAVEVTPYPGYGCKDTIFQKLDTTSLSTQADAGPDQTSCNQASVLLGTSATAGWNHSWFPATDLNDPNIANPVATPSRFTEYVLTVSSGQGGCVSKDTVRISTQTVNDTLNLNGKLLYCSGDPSGAVLSVALADSIQWFKDNRPLGIADQTQLIVQESGTYHALLFDDNCPLPFPTNSYSVQVDFPTPGIRYPEVEAAINFPVQLESRTISNDITWSPATSLDDAHSSRPYFRGIDPQLYTIRMVTPSGCETVDTQYVKTVKKIAIYVPTMFTPNGDGRNDFLRPLLLGFRKINYFRVYNRWGKLLFESQNDLPGWNGILQDAEQGPQSLVWVIEAVDIDGKTHFRRGTTILMR